MVFLAADDPTTHVTDKYLWTVGGQPLLTTHTVTVVVVAVLFVVAMIRVGRAIATGPASAGNDRYLTKGRFAQMVEALVVFLRDEMLTPVLGPRQTRRYLPFLMTLFFFILFNNLFGLIPIQDFLHLIGFHAPPVGGTATANIMVTGALALVSFVLIEAHGIRELGVKHWLMHNFGGLVPGPIYLLPVALIVFVIELAGHLIKPTALAIRLFANMFAGHTLMAVLLGFGASAARGGASLLNVGAISAISGVAAVAVTFLEVFVAFLQAFIFMFLTAVFMSLMSHEEHEEEQAMADEAQEPAAGTAAA